MPISLYGLATSCRAKVAGYLAHLLEHVGPCEEELPRGDGDERVVPLRGVSQQVVADGCLVSL